MSKKKPSERLNDCGRFRSKTVRVSGPNKEFMDSLKGIIKIVGNIESPVAPPEAWEYD
jgi:hypothetical protein